jgi:hypothetical protein
VLLLMSTLLQDLRRVTMVDAIWMIGWLCLLTLMVLLMCILLIWGYSWLMYRLLRVVWTLLKGEKMRAVMLLIHVEGE